MENNSLKLRRSVEGTERNLIGRVKVTVSNLFKLHRNTSRESSKTNTVLIKKKGTSLLLWTDRFLVSSLVSLTESLFLTSSFFSSNLRLRVLC